MYLFIYFLAKLKNEMVEHLSDHLTEFVSLHVIALLDPIVRNDGDEIFIRPSRRPILMFQLARLLETAQCQQLICAVLGIKRRRKKETLITVLCENY